MILRWYQQQSIDNCYSYFREGKNKVLIALATGSGKGVVITHLIKDAVKFNIRATVIVKRREIIKQMSRIFTRENIDHGVFMADHYMYSPKKQIQVCSIDTLDARSIYPDCELAIIDECHDCQANNYKKLLEQYKDRKIVGLTATPYTDNSMFDAFTQPITNAMLRDEGFLVPDKTFIPKIINISEVKIVNGEYHNKQLEDAASTSAIIGDIIESWRKYAANRRTILFAVNISHSKLLAECFNKAGIKALHCDANTNSRDRDVAVKKLKNKEIDILCNVNIFSTGIDIPEIEAISFCRPTRSLVYWIQAIGRGLRPSQDKKDCIILDHAGNTYLHGSAYMPREITLEKPSKKKIEVNPIKVKTCQSCFFIYSPKILACPICGTVNEKAGRKIVTKDGELIEYELTQEEIEKQQSINFNKEYYQLKNVARWKNFKDDWIYFQLIKRYGKPFCAKYGKKILFPTRMLK